MAKRLLLQNSASTDAEVSMIGRLKVHRLRALGASRVAQSLAPAQLKCGAQFTSKLEGMMNDMKRGEEHQVRTGSTPTSARSLHVPAQLAFADYLRQREARPLSMEFSVQVLTAGFWPTYPMEELELPQ